MQNMACHRPMSCQAIWYFKRKTCSSRHWWQSQIWTHHKGGFRRYPTTFPSRTLFMASWLKHPPTFILSNRDWWPRFRTLGGLAWLFMGFLIQEWWIGFPWPKPIICFKTNFTIGYTIFEMLNKNPYLLHRYKIIGHAFFTKLMAY